MQRRVCSRTAQNEMRGVLCRVITDSASKIFKAGGFGETNIQKKAVAAKAGGDKRMS